MGRLKLSYLGIRKVHVLAFIAQHRHCSSFQVARLMATLKRRERVVAKYLIASPAERRTMKLSPPHRQVVKQLFQEFPRHCHECSTSPS